MEFEIHRTEDRLGNGARINPPNVFIRVINLLLVLNNTNHLDLYKYASILIELLIGEKMNYINTGLLAEP